MNENKEGFLVVSYLFAAILIAAAVTFGMALGAVLTYSNVDVVSTFNPNNKPFIVNILDAMPD